MNLKPKSYVVNAVIAIAAVFLFPLMAHAGIEEHIIETESGFYYTVQKGDTLWDLSRKFSDSAWQWPDLWHYNPDIGNPHLIYPGQRIRIYQKSWEEMQKKQPAVAATAAPKSPKPARFHLYTAINAVGFIRKTAVEPMGTIFKVRQDKKMISTDDQVYIRPGQSVSLNQGALYAVFKTTGPVMDPVTKDNVGIQHIVCGVVEITRMEDGFVVGRITETYRPLDKDDMLMPFQSLSGKIAYTDAVPGLSGRIIKGEDDPVMIGENMTAFIDKGSKDGVQPGQTYRIFCTETDGTRSFMSEPVPLTKEYSGSLLVLHTEETTSTVLITNSVDAIDPGFAFDTFPEIGATNAKTALKH